MAHNQAECPICGGCGWVLRDRNEVEAVAPCPDCRSRARLEGLLENAQIPPRYLDRDFKVYSFQTARQEQALKRSIEYVESFPDVDRGLLFVGSCGVGKTHLSVAILKEIIQAKGISGLFVDEAEFLRRLQHSYGRGSAETAREILSPLMHVDLLVWDDLGTVRATEWVAETIHTVLNHRYTYSKHTILSTNRLLKAPASGGETLEEKIGVRLVSRLLEMCEIVEIDGPDARTTIHKARLDFEKSKAGAARPHLPESLPCVKCSSPRVDQLEVQPRQSRRGRFLEISYRCRDCGEYFAGQYYTQQAEIEYAGPN